MSSDPDRTGLRVPRAWAGAQRDNLPVAMQAKIIVEQDGAPDALLEGSLSMTGFVLVNVEDRGRRGADRLVLLDVSQQALKGGS
ncbi:MAG: hypothetical protein WD638_11955 [Nitriliruptoraceae bacterium]